MKRALGLGSLVMFVVVMNCAGINPPPAQTVFIILMENHNWSSIQGSADAPYINSLLPMASYCQQYYTPPGNHPSLPNYLWLEAGTNFGILDDNDPSVNHQSSTNHLVTLLNNAGISWKTYQEDISGTYVPLTATNNYAPWHNPFVYFDDVTGTNNPNYAYGIAHIRPYTELAGDLANNTVARYNFITPNLCHDMHDSCPPLNNPVRQGDDWLAGQVPNILNSQAYRNGGVLFIVWDEGAGSDGPIGMIALSPQARGGGYSNNTYYNHGSTLRTLQEMFGVGPLLADAGRETDLGDLFFSRYEISNITPLQGGAVQLTATGVIPGRTNLVLASTNLQNWQPIGTNVSSSNTFTFTDDNAGAAPPPVVNSSVRRFYRLEQLP